MSDTITIIGLGPMGQAMARAFVDAGHPVTVWNRTRSRADGLTGVTVADSVEGALAAGDIIVLSLTHYDAMYDILGPYRSRLMGKTLVNLSSDTPDRTREAAEWARAQGASFVTGGVMVPAPMIGTDSAYVY
ncbi:NAD(P)-binding domain-containing protein [Rhodococcus sovatensis]|uniref:NAD(P)-binding domain-containing protein n=1 Tax=Rhodococcus sovatensis TaxID=1805840 RepID=A0ABZ2PEC6_9NOCA